MSLHFENFENAINVVIIVYIYYYYTTNIANEEESSWQYLNHEENEWSDSIYIYIQII